MSWFDDDDLDVLDKKTAKKEEFTEDITFEFNEDDQPDEEDVKLAELGMLIELKDIYLKHNPNSKIFSSKGTIIKKFFQWYVDSCDYNKLSLIKKGKFSNSLLEVLEKRQQDLEEKKEEGLVNRYIDKNKELMQENEDLKKVAGNLIFLYNLMDF